MRQRRGKGEGGRVKPIAGLFFQGNGKVGGFSNLTLMARATPNDEKAVIATASAVGAVREPPKALLIRIRPISCRWAVREPPLQNRTSLIPMVFSPLPQAGEGNKSASPLRSIHGRICHGCRIADSGSHPAVGVLREPPQSRQRHQGCLAIPRCLHIAGAWCLP